MSKASRFLLSMCAVIALTSATTTVYAGTYTGCFGDKIGTFYRNNLNHDLNDFGMLLHDAHPNNGCGATDVANKLTAKVQAMNNASPNPWRGWLSGASLSMALAAGLELGPQGALSETLDAALRDAANSYYFQKGAPAGPGLPVGDECGINFAPSIPMPSGEQMWRRANSCMDDHSISASAYAWMATYFRMTGRTYSTFRSNAINRIKSTLGESDSVCVHDPNIGYAFTGPFYRGACNSNYTALTPTSSAQVVSINHGLQSPAYGVGLMTSIASAFNGLEVSGSTVLSSELTTQNKTLANYLLVEGRRKSDSWGDFKYGDCYDMQGATITSPSYVYGANAQLSTTYKVDCHDRRPVEYQPDMFPVLGWYTKHQSYGLSTTIENGGWSYDLSPTYDDQFHGTENVNAYQEFLGPGRRAVYRTLAHDWLYSSGRPPLSGSQDYKLAVKAGSYYFFAVWGGGYDMNVGGDLNNPYSRFYLYDVNGGMLNDGDEVGLRTATGFWVVAEGGGGGAVNANRLTRGPWETFVIQKRNGTGTIGNGDTFALRTSGYYYLRAQNGGGSGLDAMATYPQNWETFTFTKTEW